MVISILLVACGTDTPGTSEPTDAEPGTGAGDGAEPTAAETGTETAGEETEAAGELTELRIAMSLIDLIPFMTLVQVAADKGWFEEEGLDATIIQAGGGGDTTRLLTAGQADIAIAGPEAIYLASLAPGSNIEIIGPWYQVNDVAWVGNIPDATIDDLQGARLGITGAGSTGDFISKAMAAERPDLNIESVIVGGLGDNLTAMKAGEIDGAYTADPIKTQQVVTEGVHVLVNSREIIGDIPMDLVAVNTNYAEQNPEAVEAFWRVADRVFTYMREDTAAAAADVNEYVNMDPDILAQVLENTPRFDEAYSIVVDCEAMQNWADRMIAAEVIDEPVDWSESLNQSYLPEEARCDEF